MSIFRGVYLACLLYHGDKVLVTSDDQLPIVEVDENFSGPSIYNDFHWLMKVIQSFSFKFTINNGRMVSEDYLCLLLLLFF